MSIAVLYNKQCPDLNGRVKHALTPTSPTCVFSLALSLVEKEGRLLVLQEADSVRQQELSSLRQDIQEAQEGQRELSVQVPH